MAVNGLISGPLKVLVFPTLALGIVGGAEMAAAWSGTATEGVGVTVGVISEDAKDLPSAIERGKAAAAGGGPE